MNAGVGEAVAEDAFGRERFASAERMLDAVFEQLPAMIVVQDAKTLRYLRINKAAERLFGLPAAALLGFTPAQVLPPARARWVERHCHDALGTLRAVEVPEVALRLREGGWRFLKTTIVPILDPHGAPACLVGMFEDVSERTKARSVLRRRMRAADGANRAKSAFLATMSHEIRSPMNGVTGMAEILQRTPLSAEQASMTETIRESAASLVAIVDDILDFSKIEAGRLELEQVPFSLSGLLEGVTDAIGPIAQRRGVELLGFCDPAIDVNIESDPVRLRQILVNLTDNAVKFAAGVAGRKGRVMLRADLVRRDNAIVRVCFRVMDNGIGMAPQAAARLFQPFTQAASHTTRRHGGTGLGLSICRRLAVLFGGSIEVSSVEGEGSVFSVGLDFRAGERLQAWPGQAALAGLQVVLNSRDAATAELLRRYAAACTASVTQVADVAAVDEALAQLSERQAGSCGVRTLLVLDRPDLPASGRTALDALCDRWRGKRISVLVLERGRRQRARLLEPGIASLDLDSMRRAAFMQGIALAAGIDASEPAQLARAVAVAGGAAEPSQPRPRSPSQHRVLVAEDNPINRKVLRHQLALLGYRADFAADGRQALARWEAGGYSMVLTDCDMPEMDGFELAAAIRRTEEVGRRTPIIAITANVLEGEAQRCARAGMDGYLTKPCDLHNLDAALNRWLPAEAAAGPQQRREVPKERSQQEARGDAKDEALQPAPAIDPRALAMLLGTSDDAIIRDVLLDFVDNGAATLRDMKGLLQSRGGSGAREVAALAHRFKSSAAAVGAQALSSACRRLEQAGNDGEWREIDTLIGAIDRQFHETAACVHAHA